LLPALSFVLSLTLLIPFLSPAATVESETMQLCAISSDTSRTVAELVILNHSE
jgi:hypothetical protein